MRLLNTNTYAIEEFVGSSIPRYAILSHTWGKEEVTFADMRKDVNSAKTKLGFMKLDGFCAMARSNFFEWVWMDTCCIDKTSSAELSEAINSMYAWYRQAAICYVFLEDVESANDASIQGGTFEKSRWFTRGWTLQELLAPQCVLFHARDWTEVGSKFGLAQRLSLITKIDKDIFLSASSFDCPVAEKMSWAACRETTRIEDIAYCLLGIFDVNLPLLYGEGHKAFQRLQEEIIRTTEDYTIYLWSFFTWPPILPRPVCDVIAASPKDFDTGSSGLSYDDIGERRSVLRQFDRTKPPEMTSRGLRFTLPALYEPSGPYHVVFLGLDVNDRLRRYFCETRGLSPDKVQNALICLKFRANGRFCSSRNYPRILLVDEEYLKPFKTEEVYHEPWHGRESYERIERIETRGEWENSYFTIVDADNLLSHVERSWGGNMASENPIYPVFLNLGSTNVVRCRTKGNEVFLVRFTTKGSNLIDGEEMHPWLGKKYNDIPQLKDLRSTETISTLSSIPYQERDSAHMILRSVEITLKLRPTGLWPKVILSITRLET